MCVGPEADGENIQELTAAWVRNIFQHCCGSFGQGPCPELNEERLRRLLEAGRFQDAADPWGQLESMGAWLPEDTQEEVVADVVARLKEAETAEEDEIFTGERVVVCGHVTPGMAAVVRQGRQGSGSRSHVFIYDFESIKEWQQLRRTDPSTREALAREQILPLARPSL
eukprot:gnl/TRDRNA2_/TRDRNA2_115787_c1_seq1.p2 gnl/TRDRNA2_/TRDRNA2_115787_c1~~gnl/TRDRNA2_/TRDRNA2_115787_c1_seq1.p2  ORF type:complete len:169 (+),score=33.49 gnl/TRDRNA2_/TRDRNA2_115787_c1_seq1:1-507(+)